MVIEGLNGNDRFPYLLKRNLRTEAVEASDAAIARMLYDSLFDDGDLRDHTFGSLRGGGQNEVDTGSHALSFV